MYLKRLEIKGFKSFADKTVLDFMPPKSGRFSVTAIVGPNGSGKSNISDAVRWVMGEQSVKTLRGKKSEDVIFSGSETKGQLGAAEVSMILDNSDGRLMSDFSEITITRRLYRSGESEYLVNNNAVRMLDIHLLLAKAQFAQHSYSVIGQGTIDRLLTVGPAERKDFLDEASGIKEFQIKQHQAQLKLTRTSENIEQAERLMQEVEPRLKILAKQVKKLEKRQEVEIALRACQENYFSSIYLANKTEIDSLQNNLNAVEVDYRQTFKELESIQIELASLAHASTRQDVFNDLQAKHQALVGEQNDLERQIAIKDGQMHAEYSHAGKQNINWTENKLASLRLEQNQINSKLTSAQTETNASEKLFIEQKNEMALISKERADCQMSLSELERQILFDQSEQKFRQYSGLTAAQAILENKEKFGKIYGLLAELGEVNEKYRTALEVAAGNYLSAIVAAEDETAKKAIEFLRSNRLGIATFLPMNKITPRSFSDQVDYILAQPGVLGLASELVKHESKFNDIFSFVFGQTVVVETLADAQRIGIGRCRMVTLAGDLIEKTGVMKGGYRHAKTNGLSFSAKLAFGQNLTAEIQIKITAEKNVLSDLNIRFENLKIKMLDTESKLNTAKTTWTLLSEENKKLSSELAGLEQELSLLNADPKQYGDILKNLSEEKNKLAGALSEKEKEIAKLADKIFNFNKEEEEKKQKVFALQDLMQHKQNALNQVLSSRNDLKIQLAKIETKQDALRQDTMAEMSETVESILERKPQTTELAQIGGVAEEIQKLKYQLSLIGGIDEEVVSDYQQTKERYEFLSGQINDLRGAMEDLQKMIVELDEVMKKKRSSAFKKIRKEFDRYIKILFGGGDGDMQEIYCSEPEQEEDLECSDVQPDALRETVKGSKILVGIDITINPPGKKIKHINTLSGGERTLASIALICAVLNYNPSPFVVLDEVEAALDETNTRRFAQIVSELSTQSQFIIITHNRVTMHSADALYGVVMGVEGISKLLSVKMEDVSASGRVNLDK